MLSVAESGKFEQNQDLIAKIAEMSQSSSQQLEASVTFDQSQSAWRAIHAPHVARKGTKVEIPVGRLRVVNSEFEWKRIASPAQEGGLLARGVPFEEVVLSLLLPVARAVCKQLEGERFDDTFFAKVLLGETLWRTQTALRCAPLRQA